MHNHQRNLIIGSYHDTIQAYEREIISINSRLGSGFYNPRVCKRLRARKAKLYRRKQNILTVAVKRYHMK